MDALYYIILFTFVIICIMLVGIILLQSSQTGGLGSALAGNALNSAFGGQGADKLLVRITSVLAALFMILAISLNILETPGSNKGVSFEDKSVMERNKLESMIEVPIKTENNEVKKDSL